LPRLCLALIGGGRALLHVWASANYFLFCLTDIVYL